MPDRQEHHRADHGDEKASDVEARHSGSTKGVEEPVANHRAHDTSTMAIGSLSSCLLTSVLAMWPAMSPKMIQPISPMAMIEFLKKKSRRGETPSGIQPRRLTRHRARRRGDLPFV
jgi:hypothetical protein